MQIRRIAIGAVVLAAAAIPLATGIAGASPSLIRTSLSASGPTVPTAEQNAIDLLQRVYGPCTAVSITQVAPSPNGGFIARATGECPTPA